MRENITYDDALLVPQYSTIESRTEVDLEQKIDKNISLSIPIISSPMDTITEKDMVVALDEVGALGVLHRYNPVMKQAEMAYHCNEAGAKNIGAAIGVTNDYLVRAEALVNIGHVNVLCVDVAHGHHVLVERALKSLKDKFGDTVHLMAGNVATLEGFNDLADWGADSIRCGIGGGSICTTRIQTGHGVSGLETIFECAKSDRDAKIIADGGIKNSGDIVKALAAGADFVMLGSLMAGTTESSGQIITYTDGSRRKAYRGMASAKAQKARKGKYSTPEGVATNVPYQGSVKNIIKDLVGGIKSGCSYSGARSLHELRTSAKWTRQSAASMAESLPHILGRS
jgi:IMP dehydrogenase